MATFQVDHIVPESLESHRQPNNIETSLRISPLLEVLS